MVGKNRFRTFSSVVATLRSRSPRPATELQAAVSLANEGTKICSRLTSLRYDTTGFVAIGVRTHPATQKKAVRSSAVITSAIGDLFGLRLDGTSAPVISLVNPNDNSVNNSDVGIWRVYQAPDGSIYTLYHGHPEGCRLGRVELGAHVEVCMLSNGDLPDGISFGGVPPMNETYEPVKFDGLGNAYVIVSGIPKGRDCSAAKYPYAEHVIEINPAGDKRWLESPSCWQGIAELAGLTQGGLIFWEKDGGNLSWVPPENNRLMVWKDGVVRVLLTKFNIAPNGLQVMPDGNVIVSMWDHTSDLFATQHQGGIIKFDETSGELVPWYDYRASGPRFSVEDIANPLCSCKSQIQITYPLVRNGSSLFGFGRIYNGTTTSTAAASQTYLWRVYPSMEPLLPVPDISSARGLPTLVAAMSHSLLVSAGDYVGCYLTSTRFNQPSLCEYSLTRVDPDSGVITSLVTPQDGIAVLGLASDSTGTSTRVEAIRLADKRYLVGSVDETQTSISWTPTSPAQFEQLTFLDRVLNPSP